MKLSNIYSSLIFSRPVLHNSKHNPSMGNDSGNKNKGNTNYPTGMPHKRKHRKFFGEKY